MRGGGRSFVHPFTPSRIEHLGQQQEEGRPGSRPRELTVSERVRHAARPGKAIRVGWTWTAEKRVKAAQDNGPESGEFRELLVRLRQGKWGARKRWDPEYPAFLPRVMRRGIPYPHFQAREVRPRPGVSSRSLRAGPFLASRAGAGRNRGRVARRLGAKVQQWATQAPG